MNKAEIIEELTRLSAEERAEIRAKLDELEEEEWVDAGELSAEDKRSLDAALEEYKKDPNGGSFWEEVEARIRKKLRS